MKDEVKHIEMEEKSPSELGGPTDLQIAENIRRRNDGLCGKPSRKYAFYGFLLGAIINLTVFMAIPSDLTDSDEQEEIFALGFMLSSFLSGGIGHLIGRCKEDNYLAANRQLLIINADHPASDSTATRNQYDSFSDVETPPEIQNSMSLSN